MSNTGPPAFQPFYQGPGSNFPRSTTWLSFDDLFNANKSSMSNNGDNGPDIGNIFNAIQSASQIGVDPRLILAIVMQESHGFVGAGGTTDADGQTTGGLMQCFGSPFFTGQNSPQVTQDDVTAMINAGTQHFRDNLTSVGLPPGQWNDDLIYAALRQYNSGSVNFDDLDDINFNGTQAGTTSYVSDVANRLQGQVN